jgi:HK97 family phage major capsid protein
MTEQTAAELSKEVLAEVKITYDALDKKTTDLGQVLDKIKEKIDAKADTTDLDNRLKGLTDEIGKLAKLTDDVDKKLSRPGFRGEEEKSLGQRVAQSEGFKTFAKNGGGRFNFDAKAVITTDLSVAAQTLTAGVPRQQAGLVGIPDRMLNIRDLIPIGATASNAIEYPRETLFTNAAAPVAENTAKAESNFDMTIETAPVRTIAHFFRVSKQLMDDMGMLSSYIDQRLRYGLSFAEEGQLLNGNNTGQNLNGIIPQASLFPASVATSGIPGGLAAQRVDIIRWAKLLVRQALFPATAVVLNPEDWARIELLKDSQNAYLYSAFTSGAEQRLWGLRVVESDTMTAGTFLVGSFAMGAQIWDREQANVVLSTEDADNITKNMITIRGEERLALTVYRPAAFVRGSFTLTA